MGTELRGLLACPSCREPLKEGRASRLECPACAAGYVTRNGIPRLLPGDTGAGTSSGPRPGVPARFADARLSSDWYLGLPHAAAGESSRWASVADNLDAAEELLERLRRSGKPSGPVLDLGAGSCWLAARLASQGYEVVAVDDDLSTITGLKAADTYLPRLARGFFRVAASPERLPFGSRTFAAVVAANHPFQRYDPVSFCREASRVLVQDGVLVLLDCAVTNGDLATGQATAPGAGRTVDRSELVEALRMAGFSGHLSGSGSGLLTRLVHGILNLVRLPADPIIPLVVARRSW